MAGGRPKGKYSQAYRLVRMLEMLLARHHLTVKMVIDEFNISRRTAHRDLATLQETYSICEAGSLPDGQKIWRLVGTRQNEILKLSVMEMAALFMGKNLFNFTRGTALKNSIDSLFTKVSHRLASNRSSYRTRLETKFYCTPGSPKDYTGLDDQLNELVTGLLEEQAVEIEYQRPGSDPYRDTIHPWSLVVHNHALYLIAYSERAEAVRTFAVERVRSAKWKKGVSFDYPEGYTPGDYLSHAFGITVGQPVTVLLQLRPEVVDYFRHRQWHPSQKIETFDNQATRVHLEVPITAELVSWLLSFGDKIEVMEPTSLRRQLRKESLGIMTLYEPDAPLN